MYLKCRCKALRPTSEDTISKVWDLNGLRAEHDGSHLGNYPTTYLIITWFQPIIFEMNKHILAVPKTLVDHYS